MNIFSFHFSIFKKQFVFSKDKPHQVLHSCDCYNTPGLLRSTKDVWWVRKKTVKRSVSQSLEVKPNDPRWTAGRVRWAGSTQCLRTWGPRESRWVVWHCRRVFTTPESSWNGQPHERSIRQAFWNMKYNLGIDMICQRQGVRTLASLSRIRQKRHHMKDQNIYSPITDFSKATVHQPHLFPAVTLSTAYSHFLEIYPIRFNKCIIQTKKEGSWVLLQTLCFIYPNRQKCACLQALI